MHHNLWLYSTIVIFLIVLAKIVSAKTRTVDVLWLILFGSIAVNFGILPKEHQVIEAIGEWGIVCFTVLSMVLLFLACLK